MTNEVQAEAGDEAAAAGTAETAETAEPPKIWRPSRKPEHRIDQASVDDHRLIIERGEEGGIVAVLLRYLKRPFVKLIVGLGLFILGAIVYDATINFGRWTERPPKQKAAEHRGVRPVPLTPDG